MEGDDLFSADPEKILKRAMSDVRFARSGYEAGHKNQALLLMIRGLEKLLLYLLMVRNIPYSRDTNSLVELFDHLSDTAFHDSEWKQLCEKLDVFQFERRDEVMDIIQDDDQYMKLSELDEQDVEEQRARHQEELEDEDLEDWENDEWGPEGWTSSDVSSGEEEGRDGSGSFHDQETPTEEEGVSTTDPDHEMDDANPTSEELYERSITFFKSLYDLVDAEDS